MTKKEFINHLGLKAKDKVTGLEGVITSVSFDLYGCLQALITPPAKDGETKGSTWIDIERIEVSDERVMDCKYVDESLVTDSGPAEKPIK